MASLRQITANRQNAQSSTGPRTDEGKAASRANSMKHGLTGAGVVLSSDDADAVAKRMDAWRPWYQPINNEEEWLFRDMVTQSIRLDHCHDQEALLLAQISLRASLCWDDDRELEAEILGEKLAKKPAKVVKELAATKQGCEWMLDRWRTLDLILETGGEWTDAQRSLALDLLGTAPEFRDPEDDLGSSSALLESRDLIRLEIAKLERRKTEALEPLDEFEHAAAEKGLVLKMTRELALLRRYEAACLQRYQAARARLRPIAVTMPETSVYLPPLPPVEPIAPISPRIEIPTAPTFARCSMSPAPSPQPTMNRRQRRAAEKVARTR